MRCTGRAQSQSDKRLQTFLEQTQLRLSPEGRKLCVHALDMMTRSRDVLHGCTHIERMLQDLVLWLRNDPALKSRIESSAEALVLAICCHDLWKSQRIPKKGSLYYLWGCVWDGPGSAQIFKQLAQEFRLSQKLTQQTVYAIRVHSGTQLRPRKTLAAKMLNDLDVLDYLSAERMNAVRAFVLDQPHWRQILINKIRGPIDLIFGPSSAKRRYFEWADSNYRQRSLAAFANIGLLPPSRRPASVQANYQIS